MLFPDRQIYEAMMCESPVIRKEYVSHALRLNPSQAVDGVVVDNVEETNTALTIRFSARITEMGREETSVRFFAKTVKSRGRRNAYLSVSVREAEFYQMVLKNPGKSIPAVRCHDAYLSEDRLSYFILLEDISGEYSGAGALNLADRGIWFSAAECLARFHAAFWNLGEADPAALPKATPLDEAVNGTLESYGKFKACIDGRLDGATIALFDHAVRINVTLLGESRARRLGRNNVTIIHDDSHIHNFMFPRDPGGKPVLVDFQFWNVGYGAGDLAHLSRSFPDASFAALHRPLAQRYHRTLSECGVQGYSWEQCWDDYRKHVADMLLIPVWQYTSFGLPYDDWIGDIPGLVANFLALECDRISVPARYGYPGI